MRPYALKLLYVLAVAACLFAAGPLCVLINRDPVYGVLSLAGLCATLALFLWTMEQPHPACLSAGFAAFLASIALWAPDVLRRMMAAPLH